jgi:hypothetical protein
MMNAMRRLWIRPALVVVVALPALPVVGTRVEARASSNCGGFCDFQCATPAERAITCAQGSGGTCGIGSTCYDGSFGGPCGLGAYYVECHGHET